MAKTTKRNFKLFRETVEYWVARFGLLEWRLDFEHDDCGDSWSTINPLYSHKAVNVCLNTDWGKTDAVPLTDEAIRMTAKHEAIEILIADLRILAESPFVTQDEVRSVSHTLVRRLEHIIQERGR